MKEDIMEVKLFNRYQPQLDAVSSFQNADLLHPTPVKSHC